MPAPELAASADAPVGDGITNADEGVGAPSEAPGEAPSNDRGWFSRGYLPHFDSSFVIQAVTYRLADSLPNEVAKRMLADYPEGWKSPAYRKRIEDYVDAGHGACRLKRPEVAQIVLDRWRRFDGVRYRLHAWVIMPNHVHVVVQTIAPCDLASAVEGWKSCSARKINKIFCRRGAVWQREYWDRFIRDEQHYQRAVAYVHENPVKAGLVSQAEDWPWSSASLLGAPTPSSATELAGSADALVGDGTCRERRRPRRRRNLLGAPTPPSATE
jgi:REP element-mobilizing transposase RayT